MTTTLLYSLRASMHTELFENIKQELEEKNYKATTQVNESLRNLTKSTNNVASSTKLDIIKNLSKSMTTKELFDWINNHKHLDFFISRTQDGNTFGNISPQILWHIFITEMASFIKAMNPVKENTVNIILPPLKNMRLEVNLEKMKKLDQKTLLAIHKAYIDINTKISDKFKKDKYKLNITTLIKEITDLLPKITSTKYNKYLDVIKAILATIDQKSFQHHHSNVEFMLRDMTISINDVFSGIFYDCLVTTDQIIAIYDNGQLISLYNNNQPEVYLNKAMCTDNGAKFEHAMTSLGQEIRVTNTLTQEKYLPNPLVMFPIIKLTNDVIEKEFETFITQTVKNTDNIQGMLDKAIKEKQLTLKPIELTKFIDYKQKHQTTINKINTKMKKDPSGRILMATWKDEWMKVDSKIFKQYLVNNINDIFRNIILQSESGTVNGVFNDVYNKHINNKDYNICFGIELMSLFAVNIPSQANKESYISQFIKKIDEHNRPNSQNQIMIINQKIIITNENYTQFMELLSQFKNDNAIQQTDIKLNYVTQSVVELSDKTKNCIILDNGHYDKILNAIFNEKNNFINSMKSNNPTDQISKDNILNTLITSMTYDAEHKNIDNVISKLKEVYSRIEWDGINGLDDQFNYFIDQVRTITVTNDNNIRSIAEKFYKTKVSVEIYGGKFHGNMYKYLKLTQDDSALNLDYHRGDVTAMITQTNNAITGPHNIKPFVLLMENLRGVVLGDKNFLQAIEDHFANDVRSSIMHLLPISINQLKKLGDSDSGIIFDNLSKMTFMEIFTYIMNMLSDVTQGATSEKNIQAMINACNGNVNTDLDTLWNARFKLCKAICLVIIDSAKKDNKYKALLKHIECMMYNIPTNKHVAETIKLVSCFIEKSVVDIMSLQNTEQATNLIGGPTIKMDSVNDIGRKYSITDNIKSLFKRTMHSSNTSLEEQHFKENKSHKQVTSVISVKKTSIWDKICCCFKPKPVTSIQKEAKNTVKKTVTQSTENISDNPIAVTSMDEAKIKVNKAFITNSARSLENISNQFILPICQGYLQQQSTKIIEETSKEFEATIDSTSTQGSAQVDNGDSERQKLKNTSPLMPGDKL